MSKLSRVLCLFFSGLATWALVSLPTVAAAPPPENPQNGALGVEGTIRGEAPTRAATITVPTSGQVFTKLPITVSGICPQNLLVKLFKNGVFSGSAQCTTGSYSILIDLFSGQNDLIARVYDALDQAGPDSNTVSVTFSDNQSSLGPRVTITSGFAKRGANPGETLTWPLTISGGTPPFAVSVDWGDQKLPDLFTRETPGDFTVEHVYDKAGVYNIIIKATDANGISAFLQLVGIGNGPIGQDNSSNQASGSATQPQSRSVLWWPILVLLVLTILSFWLGKRHQLQIIRNRLHRGDRPFGE